MTLGFVLRIVYHGNLATLGAYIAQYMFILLSVRRAASSSPLVLALRRDRRRALEPLCPALEPVASHAQLTLLSVLARLQPCAFLANNYLLLSRLSRAIGPDATSCLFLPAHHVGTIFIWSDVVTFLMQAGGGGLTASGNASSATTGKYIALAGLSIQLASYLLFTSLLVVFYRNAYVPALSLLGSSARSLSKLTRTFPSQLPPSRAPRPTCATFPPRVVQVLVELQGVRLAPARLDRPPVVRRRHHALRLQDRRVLRGCVPLLSLPASSRRPQADSHLPGQATTASSPPRRATSTSSTPSPSGSP